MSRMFFDSTALPAILAVSRLIVLNSVLLSASGSRAASVISTPSLSTARRLDISFTIAAYDTALTGVGQLSTQLLISAAPFFLNTSCEYPINPTISIGSPFSILFRIIL